MTAILVDSNSILEIKKVENVLKKSKPIVDIDKNGMTNTTGNIFQIFLCMAF